MREEAEIELLPFAPVHSMVVLPFELPPNQDAGEPEEVRTHQYDVEDLGRISEELRSTIETGARAIFLVPDEEETAMDPDVRYPRSAVFTRMLVSYVAGLAVEMISLSPKDSARTVLREQNSSALGRYFLRHPPGAPIRLPVPSEGTTVLLADRFRLPVAVARRIGKGFAVIASIGAEEFTEHDIGDLFDGLAELVIAVTYETITHTDPDVTITESFTRNSAGQVTSHTDGEGVVTEYEYYSSGAKKGLLLRKTVDYGSGKLNLETAFDYSDTRYLTSLTDPDENVWSYEVDEEGNRTKTTSPGSENYETEYTFSADGYLLTKDVENVDETNTRVTANPWWTTTYSMNVYVGKVSSITEEIDASTTRTTSFTYSANGELTQITRPEGNKIRQVFDERGLLAERTRGYDSSDASTEKWAYDGNGNPTTYTNGRSKTWTKTFDDYDRLTTDTTPLDYYTSYVLDKNGQVTEVKGYDDDDVLMAHTKHYYDEVGRIWKTERWLDHEAPTADEWLATTFTHDNRGQVIQITDPEGSDTYLDYDNAGRRTSWEDDLGNEITYSYANDYLVATQIQEIELVPGGGSETFTTEVVTDALHRVTEQRIVDRDNSSNKHTFKAKHTSLNVVVEREDAEGNKTYAIHDGLGRITKTEVDLGGSDEIETWFTFDDNDNQIGLEDDNGNETAWAYNDRDLPTSITYDDSTHRDFVYLADDSVSYWTDENGTVVTNYYTDEGRLSTRTIDRATGVLGPTAETYAWDALGRMVTAQNSNSTVYRTYDTLSRLVAEEQGPNPMSTNGKTISYTYRSDGARETCTYPSGYELTYTTDSVGRWTKIEDSSSNDLATFSFYGPGRRTKQVSYLNGTSENYAWDGFRNVTDLDHKDSQSTVFAGFDYAYDAMGNPLYEERTHESGHGDIYQYDKAYRLTAALLGSYDPSGEIADSDWLDYAHVKKIVYNMDDVGNRTSVVETPYQGSPVTTSYTTNSVNQYTAVGGVSKSYDSNGNLLTGSTLSYDYRNNLVKVADGETVIAEYQFDALNRRIEKDVDEVVTHSYYDGWERIQDYDDTPTLQRTFVFGQGIDEPHLMLAADVADVDDDENTSEILNFYYHRNRLGSITHITIGTEEVVEQYVCDPYGITRIFDGDSNDLSGESAIGNPFIFTGREYDEETGRHYYRMRVYDAAMGRFLQRDNFGTHYKASLYSYCGGQPTSAVDPTGRDVVYLSKLKALAHDAAVEEAGALAKSDSPEDRQAYSKAYQDAYDKALRIYVAALRAAGDFIVDDEEGVPYLSPEEERLLVPYAKLLLEYREFWIEVVSGLATPRVGRAEIAAKDNRLRRPWKMYAFLRWQYRPFLGFHVHGHPCQRQEDNRPTPGNDTDPFDTLPVGKGCWFLIVQAENRDGTMTVTVRFFRVQRTPEGVEVTPYYPSTPRTFTAVL